MHHFATVAFHMLTSKSTAASPSSFQSGTFRFPKAPVPSHALRRDRGIGALLRPERLRSPLLTFRSAAT